MAGNSSGIVTAQTGDPFTVYTGTDQSATAGKDRAVITGNPYGGNACAGAAPCLNWLSVSAFGLPLSAVSTPASVYAAYPFRFGNVGKDSVRGPGLFNWDMGLAKEFPLRETISLQFRAEFFNAFNNVNFSDPVSTISSGGFGSIRSAADPRIGQLALKLRF